MSVKHAILTYTFILSDTVKLVKRPLDSPEEGLAKKQKISTRDCKCRWCGKMVNLVPGKTYCHQCSSQGNECKGCHRPLGERYYTKAVEVCDACVTKRENASNKRMGGASQSALKGSLTIKELEPLPANKQDLLMFLKDTKHEIENYLVEKVLDKRGIKWSLTATIRFKKCSVGNEEIVSEPSFNSITVIATLCSQLNDQLDSAFNKIYKSFEEYQRDGSGWVMDQVIKLEVKVAQYLPIAGSSYIPLPKKLQAKKALINIQNDDQECFKWCVLAALHPANDHVDRVSNYTQYETDLDWSMLEFPTRLCQIPLFEKENKISINVFTYEDGKIYPLLITEHSFNQHVNLLLITNGQKRHFVLIKDLSRLLGDRTKHHYKAYYCKFCLHGFIRQDILDEHIPYCSPHGAQKVTLPNGENKWLEFKNHAKGLRAPFAIYADFECVLKDVDNIKGDSTKQYQKHEPSGYCYVVVNSSEKYCKQAVVYRGERVMDHFLEAMFKESDEICEILSKIVPMQLTDQEEYQFKEALNCHICDEVLGSDRVRDHDHLTGLYRGAAHKSCNLNFKFSKENERNASSFKIPIIFHNL